MMKKTEENNEWNATQYNKHASFVSDLAMPVVALLNPKKDEKILDLGCGEGTLALEIEKFGAKVVAIDLSEDMIEKSLEKGLEAQVMNATELLFKEEFTAVFSNATLHWVKQSELAVQKIYESLEVGGRFVAEFGGEGNIYHIQEAMREVFNGSAKYGEFKDMWFFPSVNEYQKILENQGFKVKYIELIPRPTPIDDIANWLAVFSNGFTEHLTSTQQQLFRDEVREILKHEIYTQEEGWVADYVRIRVEVYKV
jgi:2-isopropylmalate synthase